MTLDWTKENTFLPVNNRFLPSSKENDLIGPAISYDGSFFAAKRRNLVRLKGKDVMNELLNCAQSIGYHTNYVLFDTWFSNPAQIIAIKNLGLDSIAMIKKVPTFTMSTKEISSPCQIWPSRP